MKHRGLRGAYRGMAWDSRVGRPRRSHTRPGDAVNDTEGSVMPNRHRTAIGAIVLVLALAPTGASAQGASAPPTTPSASGDATVPTGPVTTVGAIEYEYTDLPTSVPAGTSLNLRNE